MAIRRLFYPSERFDLDLPGKEFDLVGLGLNAVDHLCVVPCFPRFDTKTEILEYRRLGGGQTATAVVFLARMGKKGKYVGKVGADESGRFSRSDLEKEKIDISAVRTAGRAPNQYAFIIVDRASGERTILWRRDPELDFGEGELRREDICAGRILLLDGHDHDAAVEAARWANEEGIPVVLDLDKVNEGSAELVERAAFLIASANFPPEFTSVSDPVESLLELDRCSGGFTAVTMGARGAMAVLGGRCVAFPAFRVRAVDTTGAGDIFHGAFIYGLLENWPLAKIMGFANAAAALGCTRLGARAGIHTLDEIFAFMG